MPTSFFGWIQLLLDKYGTLFLQGAGVTMLIAVVGTTVGFLIGLLVAILRTFPLKFTAPVWQQGMMHTLRFLLSAYIEVFRGTPMIVQAMVVYYGALQYLKLDIPALSAAFLVVSVNTGAYMAEIVRGGILSVDAGQKEAATAVGMTHWQAMVQVVIPQVLRNILPSISNEFVINIKDTSVLNVIGVTELYYMAGVIKRINLQTFQVYTVVCVLYFILTFTVTRLLRLAEKKLAGSASYVICGAQSDSHAEIHIKEAR